MVLLAIVLIVGVPAFFGVWALQDHRRRAGLLREARGQLEAGRPEQALKFVGEYLRRDPNDPEALGLRAELLADSARTAEQIQQAIQACERVLRMDPDPPSRQQTRRRLVRLYLELEPHVALGDLRYQTAQRVVDELIRRGGPEGAEAQDYHLRGRVLEGLARQADEAGEPFLQQAVAAYREALDREPSDVEGAERLANLYQRLGQSQAAEDVLANLVGPENYQRLVQAADPEADVDAVLRDLPSDEALAPAYLAIYRHHVSGAEPAEGGDAMARAAVALKAAIQQKPDDPEIRLAAASFEAQARNDPKAARRHLAALSPTDRESLQARSLAGLIDLLANDLDHAVENWRQGLLAVGGSDADLTWWLAYVLLQLDRVEEAAPLIDQFHRLVGQEATTRVGDQRASTPEHVLLLALKLQKLGRSAEAIPALELARLQINPPLRPQANFVLGQCYEGPDVHDRSKALEAYQEAVRQAPGWSPPRLAIIRLLEVSNPAAAAREFDRALAEAPNDPALLVAAAERTFRNPSADRSWARTEQLLARAEAAAPGSPRVALARADYLAATGRLDEAIEQLGRGAQGEFQDRVEIWTAYAAGLVRQGRVAEAIDALERAIRPEAAGDHASLRILLARLRTRQGQGRQARAELVAELDRLPETQRPLVWQALAELQLAQGDLDAADQALQRAVALAPTDPTPRLLRLDLALATGNDQAIDAQVEALRGLEGLYGHVGQVHQILRRLRRDPAGPDDPRVAEAQRLIDEIHEQAPGLPAGHLLRGLLREQLGDDDGAIDAYDEVVRSNRSRSAMPRLAALLQRRGRPEDLQRLGGLAAALGSEADTRRYLAQVLAQAGDRDGALRLITEIVRDHPENLQMQLWAARFLNSLDAPEEGERALRDLIRRQPTEPGPRLALLAFQVEAGHRERALETIAEIAERTVADRLEFLLAQCYRLVGQDDRATELFDQALQKWPADPAVRRAAVEFHEGQGRLAEAEAIVRTGLDDADATGEGNGDGLADEPDPWAVRKLALMLSARSGDAEARAEARRLVGPDGPLGDAPEDRLVRAVVLARGPEPADRDEAAERLEALVDDLPANEPLAITGRQVLIELLINDGRPEPAVRHAEALAAEALRPDAATIALCAEVLLRAERFDQVERQVQRLALLDPDDLRVPLLRARALRNQGDEAAAAAVIEADAERRDPSGEGIKSLAELVRWLLVLKAPEAAERMARRIADAESARSWLLAEVLVAQGELEPAIAALETALDAGAPGQELVPALRGIVAVAGGAEQLDRAEDLVRRVLRSQPEDPEIVLQLALIRHFQGRFEEEVELYARVEELGPENALHLNNWAWTLCEDLDRPEEALPRVDQALQQARPKDLGPVLDTKGVILTRLGELDEAIRHLEAAAQVRPAAVTYFHLARAYQRADRAEPARAAAEQAQRLGLDLSQLSERDLDDWDALNTPGRSD